jgi:hypothetical protein
MRDRQLAHIATQLVETATEMEESIKSASQLRERFLREVRKNQRCAQQHVPAEMLGMAGMAGRGYREHIEHTLARALAAEAIKGIDFEVAAEPSSFRNLIRFTAKAYVLTQVELTKLIDDAIEIGKRS